MARIEADGDPTRVVLTDRDLAAVATADEVLASQGKVMTGYTIKEARTGKVIAVQLSPKAQALMSQEELAKLNLDD